MGVVDRVTRDKKFYPVTHHILRELLTKGRHNQFWVPPQVHIVYIPRKQQVHKIQKVLDFPLEWDVAEYMHPESPYEGSTEYELFSISEHSGGASSGHYTARARIDTGENGVAGASWAYMSDSHAVRRDPRIRNGRMSSAEVVALFYVRK